MREDLQDRYVFLAASYPSREFAKTANSHEIASAVKRLLGAVFRANGRIVFGGHPAISPLVLQIAREHGKMHRVLIYQSELFRPLISEATLLLAEEGCGKIKFTKAEPGERPESGKCAKSLTVMRLSMINDTDPVAAILIGGDSGLQQELEFFEERYPGRPIIPVAAPGGAARVLLGRAVLPKGYESFAAQLTSRNYLNLMHQVVKIVVAAAESATDYKLSTTKFFTSALGPMYIGSSVTDGFQGRSINLMIGRKSGPFGAAFAACFTQQTEGHTALLAALAPNVPAKPSTVVFNRIAIKDKTEAAKMYGPVNRAVAKAVVDSVAEELISQRDVEDLVLVVGVFIQWDMNDEEIFEFSYQATKEAIGRALQEKPSIDEILAAKDKVKHPFA